ncbi:centrosomal protein of 44 kDa [Suricata suricatta]|uniref:centrosomal protein of 44 kDa n=1 Tax=Suricata suricatta TaxID=37032 RepID=UPI0011558959|nr:centrosomal protein of 44 kDa [Suricata suricatta]
MLCTAIGPKVLLVGKFLPTGMHPLSISEKKSKGMQRREVSGLKYLGLCLYLSDLRSPPPPRRIGLWAGAFLTHKENGSARNWCPGHGEAGSNFTCSRQSITSGVWTNVVWNLQRGIAKHLVAGSFEGLARRVAGGDPLFKYKRSARGVRLAAGVWLPRSVAGVWSPRATSGRICYLPRPCCARPEAFGAHLLAWRLLGTLARLRPRLSEGSLSPAALTETTDPTCTCILLFFKILILLVLKRMCSKDILCCQKFHYQRSFISRGFIIQEMLLSKKNDKYINFSHVNEDYESSNDMDILNSDRKGKEERQTSVPLSSGYSTVSSDSTPRTSTVCYCDLKENSQETTIQKMERMKKMFEETAELLKCPNH